VKQKYIDPFPQITLTSLTKPQNLLMKLGQMIVLLS